MARIDDFRSAIGRASSAFRGEATIAAKSAKCRTVLLILSQIGICIWSARHLTAYPELPRFVHPILAYCMERYMQGQLSSQFTSQYGSFDLKLNLLELSFGASLFALCIATLVGDNRIGRNLARFASWSALTVTASMACFSVVALAVTGITHDYGLVRNLLSVEIMTFMLFCMSEIVRNRAIVDERFGSIRRFVIRISSRLKMRIV